MIHLKVNFSQPPCIYTHTCGYLCLYDQSHLYHGTGIQVRGQLRCQLSCILRQNLFIVQCYVLAQSCLGLSCLHLQPCYRITVIKDVCYQVWLHVSSGDLTQVSGLYGQHLPASASALPTLCIQMKFISITVQMLFAEHRNTSESMAVCHLC